MKFRALPCISAMTLFASLAIPVRLSAQEQQQQQQKKDDHRYKFIDIGTLGGPASYYSAAGNGSLILNNRGMVAGYADKPTADPYAPNCFDADCYLAHAFRWQNSVATDLGALPGVNNSAVSGINERGWIAGFSQNGVTDPLLGGTAADAVLWKDGQIINLGTLGGYESNAVYVNNAGQVVGFSTINATPDPFSFLGAQTHTFIWENGVMRDLGTLGGPDSFPSAGGINERNGLVAGGSYTNSTPNSVTDLCGQNVPTMDPFLWQNGKMLDLGTLGGTCGFAVVANNRGQVAGLSDLAGDQRFHPFLWDRGTLTDLGTLGGDNGQPFWLNDAGEVVGEADLPGSQAHDAFLWSDGVMTDLGRLYNDTCSDAFAINSNGQIVGLSGICGVRGVHAFLWENGEPMIDLNTLIPPNSSLQLVRALNINDRGEIAGLGVPPGCENEFTCGHVFLLIPCDGDHADAEGCEDASEGSNSVTQNNPAPVTQNRTTVTHDSQPASGRSRGKQRPFGRARPEP